MTISESRAWEDTSPAVSVVVAFYEAMRSGRTDDMLALLDPGVTWHPSPGPATQMYCGHPGMIRLAQDVRATYGDYHFKFAEITEQPGPYVTVQGWVMPAPGNGPPIPVRIRYALRDGLITASVSLP